MSVFSRLKDEFFADTMQVLLIPGCVSDELCVELLFGQQNNLWRAYLHIGPVQFVMLPYFSRDQKPGQSSPGIGRYQVSSPGPGIGTRN